MIEDGKQHAVLHELPTPVHLQVPLHVRMLGLPMYHVLLLIRLLPVRGRSGRQCQPHTHHPHAIART